MEKLDTFFNRIFSVFKGIQVICIFGISGLVFLQVILREVFLIGVQWVYEWSCFMQVTLVWLGMPILLYGDKLLSVTALYNIFPTIIKRVLDVLRYLILLCCTGFMTYGYVLYVKNLGIMKSPVVGFPNWVFYGSMFFGLVMTILVLILNAKKLLRLEAPAEDPQKIKEV